MIIGVICVGCGLSVVVPVVFRAGGRMPGIPRGAALATLATLSYSGFLVGPPAIGCLAHYIGLRAGLALVAVLAVILSILAPAVQMRPRVTGEACKPSQAAVPSSSTPM